MQGPVGTVRAPDERQSSGGAPPVSQPLLHEALRRRNSTFVRLQPTASMMSDTASEHDSEQQADAEAQTQAAPARPAGILTSYAVDVNIPALTLSACANKHLPRGRPTAAVAKPFHLAADVAGVVVSATKGHSVTTGDKWSMSVAASQFVIVDGTGVRLKRSGASHRTAGSTLLATLPRTASRNLFCAGHNNHARRLLLMRAFAAWVTGFKVCLLAPPKHSAHVASLDDSTPSCLPQ